MMKLIKLPIFIVLVMLGACESIKPSYIEKPYVSDKKIEYWNRLVGTWKGEKELEGGAHVEWIIDRESDGTFRIVFRTTDKNGKVDTSTEYGQWGVSDNIYFSITDARQVGDEIQRTDRRNPYYYDAYRVIEATDSIFHIETIIGREASIVKKIADGEGFTSETGSANKSNY
ncbi:hypothetical protein [Sessilibacter corallicola]|uniref:Lipoprotein n=1 Tax=Sessilibacter corallicola TaxID=2904075 RepID=A0ABQ0AEE1_9GAMM